jgi:hypothetical protein
MVVQEMQVLQDYRLYQVHPVQQDQMVQVVPQAQTDLQI